MATKRANRIDPNAAFAAIVGTPEPEVQAQLEAVQGRAAVPQPEAGQGRAEAVPDPVPAALKNSATAPIKKPRPAKAAANRPILAPVGASAPLASRSAPEFKNAPQGQPGASVGIDPAGGSGGMPAATMQAAAEGREIPPEADAEAKLPLVQKGYYITEEQHRRLGMAAVLQGSDRSAIVRAALEMYFAANKDVLP